MALFTLNSPVSGFSDELNYSYSSSVESDSPYTPSLPSPSDLGPCIYDGSPPLRLTDMYRKEDGDQPWKPTEFGGGGGHNTDPTDFSLHPPAVTSPLPLHAPAPLPGHSSLLFSNMEDFDYPSLDANLSQPLPQHIPPPDHVPGSPAHAACESHQYFSYASNESQMTFPTPSELLVDLAGKNAPSGNESRSENKSDTARRARRRAVAQSVGFVPTDPDSISSHEKKRHYLECLEHYVMYLHQQLNLVGVEPAKLVQVPNHRELSNRSIRTLLVHMENSNRKLNLQTLSEEQEFMALRDIVCGQGSVTEEE